MNSNQSIIISLTNIMKNMGYDIKFAYTKYLPRSCDASTSTVTRTSNNKSRNICVKPNGTRRAIPLQ